MLKTFDFYTVIVAAGMGKRFGSKKKKQFLLLGNIPLFLHSLKVFQNMHCQRGIVLVVPGEDLDYVQKIMARFCGNKKILGIIHGGKHRWQSVKNGVCALPQETSIVVIHDGVRPFITAKMVKNAVNACRNVEGVTLSVPVRDTIKRARGNRVIDTLDRRALFQIQTPQVFKREALIKAYEFAETRGNPLELFGTDECALVEKSGGRVDLVYGSYYNLKITTPEDLELANTILKIRKHINAD